MCEGHNRASIQLHWAASFCPNQTNLCPVLHSVLDNMDTFLLKERLEVFYPPATIVSVSLYIGPKLQHYAAKPSPT